MAYEFLSNARRDELEEFIVDVYEDYYYQEEVLTKIDEIFAQAAGYSSYQEMENDLGDMIITSLSDYQLQDSVRAIKSYLTGNKQKTFDIKKEFNDMRQFRGDSYIADKLLQYFTEDELKDFYEYLKDDYDYKY